MTDSADQEVSTNAIYEEILDLLERQGAHQAPTEYSYWVEIDAGGETIHPYQFLSLDVRRNYNVNFYDEMILKVKLAISHFERVLYPNREDIWVTLFRHRHPVTKEEDGQTIVGDSEEFIEAVEEYEDDPEELRTEKNVEHFRYRGILMDKSNQLLHSARGQDTNRDDESQQEPRVYHILLINPAVEKMMNRLVSDLYRVEEDKEEINDHIRTHGIFRNATLEDVVKGMLTDVCKDINEEVDEEFEIEGVDMIEPDNDDEYEQVILPHDIRLMEIPRWLHEHHGGLYEQGLGFYLQYCPAHDPGSPEEGVMQWSEDRQQGQWFWFIWPEYAVDRFDEVEDNLTIFNIPENRFESIERSYFVEGTSSLYKKVVVVATGDVSHEDQSEELEFNQGTGVRWVKGDLLENWYEEIEPGGVRDTWDVEVDAEENIEEHKGHQRESGENYIPYRPRRITSNPNYLKSKIAARQGTIIRFQWQNGDPELIYPGMPVRLYQMFDNDMDEYEGIVMACDFDIVLKARDPSEARTKTDVMLTLFMERPEKRDAEWFSEDDLLEALGEVATDQ